MSTSYAAAGSSSPRSRSLRTWNSPLTSRRFASGRPCYCKVATHPSPLRVRASKRVLMSITARSPAPVPTGSIGARCTMRGRNGGVVQEQRVLLPVLALVRHQGKRGHLVQRSCGQHQLGGQEAAGALQPPIVGRRCANEMSEYAVPSGCSKPEASSQESMMSD